MKELIKALRDICDIAFDAIDDLENERASHQASINHFRELHETSKNSFLVSHKEITRLKRIETAAANVLSWYNSSDENSANDLGEAITKLHKEMGK